MARDAAFWEGMYRAVIRRLNELALAAEHDENPAIILADLCRLAKAHEDFPLPCDDWDRHAHADRLEAESLNPTPPPPT